MIVHILLGDKYIERVEDPRIPDSLQIVVVTAACDRGQIICEVVDADVWPALVGQEAITSKFNLANCPVCTA